MDDSSDLPVGTMVEGHWGWHEYCFEHGAELLKFNPVLKHRTIDVFETSVASREYRCTQCRTRLWAHTKAPIVAVAAAPKHKA